jgi:DNA end-binding protein Ku
VPVRDSKQDVAMAQRVRTFWKGQLRLALVIIPVRLVNALDRKEQIHFHQVDRQSRQRIRYEKVAPGVGEVPKEDIVYGYEIEPGNYVLLEEEELDNLKLESRHTIELVQFVENCDIDPLYFERPYYVVPDGEDAEEPYRVIRDALRSERKAGIGQLTLRGREHLVALTPCGKGMMLETLRYENEIKDADKIFADVGSGRLRQDLVNMAKDLIEERASPFDAAAFRDHYAEALRQLVNSKLKGGKQVPVGEEEVEPPGGKVIDFTEALKRSLQKSRPGARSREAEAPARRSRARARARR